MGRYKARCPHKNKIIYPEKVALTRAKLWGWSAYKCPINSEHWHVTSQNQTGGRAMTDNTPKPNTTNSELDEILPRTHCPPSCDGYGTYAEADENGDATPAQCQWCYEVVIPLRAKIEALIASKVMESRVEELETIKKRATEHCAFKIDQYGSDLDTKDVRLAVPNKKIDERLKALQSREQDKV